MTLNDILQTAQGGRAVAQSFAQPPMA